MKIVLHVDCANTEQISGWGWIPELPEKRISVELLSANNDVIAQMNAAEYGPDLCDAGIGDGCYRFSFKGSFLEAAKIKGSLVSISPENTEIPIALEGLQKSLAWNSTVWDGNYNWNSFGEEWSSFWGGSVPQWYSSIMPRIHMFLPAKCLLEIAPGFGRWTKFLIKNCNTYYGVDLSQQCITQCEELFRPFEKVCFYKNNGLDLSAIKTASCDFVFSFDSLVHVEMDVMASYAKEILRVLTPNGCAFIHHSNALEADKSEALLHSHAASVSAKLFRREIEKNNGHVLLQEKIQWGSTSLINCFTVFSPGASDKEPIILENYRFAEEVSNIFTHHAPYSKF